MPQGRAVTPVTVIMEPFQLHSLQLTWGSDILDEYPKIPSTGAHSTINRIWWIYKSTLVE